MLCRTKSCVGAVVSFVRLIIIVCCFCALPGGGDVNMVKTEIGYIVHRRDDYDEDAYHVNEDGTVSELKNGAYLEMMRQELVREEKCKSIHSLLNHHHHQYSSPTSPPLTSLAPLPTIATPACRRFIARGCARRGRTSSAPRSIPRTWSRG